MMNSSLMLANRMAANRESVISAPRHRQRMTPLVLAEQPLMRLSAMIHVPVSPRCSYALHGGNRKGMKA